MNDWNIIKFLKIVSVIQIIIYSLVGLSLLGIRVPILPQVIGFLYLTFIPGYLLLRIFHIHKIGNVESLLFAAGLSLFTLMMTGLIINTFLPLLGIPDPLSIINLIVSISFVVVAFALIAYFRDNSPSTIEYIDLDDFFSPPCLILCSIPFLVVIGTFLVNNYNNNLLLIFMIAVIAVIPAILVFFKSIPVKYYPIAVFSMSISLLLHNALISNYIFGWDVNEEYYWSNLVLNNSLWVISELSSANGMLSIVMLAPIYSKICDLDLTWTLKLVYPLIFALVPMAIFQIVRRQTNFMIALISCFFFISLFTFYTEMLSLCRQQIAELFLALIILLFINDEIKSINRSFLLAIFGFSLIVSHYGISYIYLGVFTIAWLMLMLIKKPIIENILTKIHLLLHEEDSYRVIPYYSKIDLTFLLMYIILLFTWYIYVSSFAFVSVLDIGNRILSVMATEFLNSGSVEGLNIITSNNTVTLLHSISKYIHLTAQFLIVVGILVSITYRRMKFSKEFIALGIINLGICIASFTVPFFSSSLNTSRVYQISLIVLSPFAIIGGLEIIRLIEKVIRLITKKASKHAFSKFSYVMIALFFAIFLLFNISFIYELAGDNPNSISISQESIKKYKVNTTVAAFYQRYYTDNEIYSTIWLSDHHAQNALMYADISKIRGPLKSYGMMYDQQTKKDMIYLLFDKPTDGSYIILSYLNSKYGLIDAVGLPMPVAYIDPSVRNSSLIYDNDGSKIFIT